MDLDRLGPLAGLLRSVLDLKRVRDARSSRSLAERQFGRAWARLVAGEPVEDVALSETAAAVAAVRLAGLDAGAMMAHGLDAGEATAALERAFDDVAGVLEDGLRGRLRETLGPLPHPAEPGVVDLLVAQPRAGATAPGQRRIVLEPAESHADHSFMVAAFGVLLAPALGPAGRGRQAGLAEVFLTGLAHHLMNTSVPDAGHAGDVLLGDDLAARMATVATDRAVGTLPGALRAPVRRALAVTAEDRFDTPEALAFHAADVLDRTLEMEWHQRAARFALGDALGRGPGQLDVCHAGFYQTWQESVLQAAGVWSFSSSRGDGERAGLGVTSDAAGLGDEDAAPEDEGAEADLEGRQRETSPSGSYERGGHGAVPAGSPLAQGAGSEDGRVLEDGATVARLERRELGS